MNNRIQKIICFFGILGILCGLPSNGHTMEDAIIAVVNDELITLKELKDYAQSKYVSLVAKGFNDNQIREIMRDTEEAGINKLIEDKLILSKANEIGMIVKEEAVDERMEGVEQKYGSRQNLISALVSNGSTVTDLRNKIRDQMKVEFLINNRVRSKTYVNPKEITQYYEDNLEQFSVKDSVQLESIFLSYSNNKREALRKSIDAFIDVLSGKDFGAVIEQYSDAPSIGTIERGQLLPEVEEQVFSLDIGQFSNLIEVDTGIFIFKAIKKNPAGTAKIEDVREEITTILKRENFRMKFAEWLEGLKEDAYIEIKE